jgi:hypothetical protein
MVANLCILISFCYFVRGEVVFQFSLPEPLPLSSCRCGSDVQGFTGLRWIVDHVSGRLLSSILWRGCLFALSNLLCCPCRWLFGLATKILGSVCASFVLFFACVHLFLCGCCSCMFRGVFWVLVVPLCQHVLDLAEVVKTDLAFVFPLCFCAPWPWPVCTCPYLGTLDDRKICFRLFYMPVSELVWIV